jgi:hypothetical protein
MVRAEPVPSGAELPHAVFSIPANAVRLRPNHWDDVVDTPRPAFELYADRADLDLQAVVLEDHAVIVACLGMDDFAKIGPCPMIPPIGREVKLTNNAG